MQVEAAPEPEATSPDTSAWQEAEDEDKDDQSDQARATFGGRFRVLGVMGSSS